MPTGELYKHVSAAKGHERWKRDLEETYAHYCGEI